MEILRRYNYDVEFILRKREKEPSLAALLLHNCKQLFETLGLSAVVYYLEKKTNSGLFFKTVHLRSFQKKYIKKISRAHYDSESLKKYCKKKKFDYYICGSDQIWRREYAPSINDAFLDFAPHNAKKISYAASFGVDKWSYGKEETQNIYNSLRQFKAISVREANAIDLINNNLPLKLTQDVIHVVDPTLLLSKEDYLKIADSGVKRNGGILTYILENDSYKEAFIKNYANKHNKELYTVINPQTNKNNIAAGQAYPIEDWLAGFRDTELVITDSFHACVFSIIFEKPFVVFENEKRGNARLYDFLKLFNLENRFINKNSTDINLGNINWGDIAKKRNELREHSLNFLLTALDYEY